MAKEDELSKTERKEVIKEIVSRRKNLSVGEKNEVDNEIKKKLAGKLVSRAKEIRGEFKKQVSGAIIAAFGLIIALSWKDVITELVNQFAIVKSYGLIVSAVALTIISVIGILLISKWAKSEDKK